MPSVTVCLWGTANANLWSCGFPNSSVNVFPRGIGICVCVCVISQAWSDGYVPSCRTFIQTTVLIYKSICWLWNWLWFCVTPPFSSSHLYVNRERSQNTLLWTFVNVTSFGASRHVCGSYVLHICVGWIVRLFSWAMHLCGLQFSFYFFLGNKLR